MPPEHETPPDAPQPNYIIDKLESDKSLAIEVPTGDTHTYLRMGDSPPMETALHSAKVGDVFDGTPTVKHMNRGFIHGAEDEKEGNLDKFVQVGGWYDHTDGNRVTTTAKSKVEIIKGYYKLITCDGKAGIDFSGGHLRMWSETPGCLTKVLDGKNDGATETTEIQTRYSTRFIGGNYDESYLGTSYESYIGKASPHDPPAGQPDENPAQGTDTALGKYHQEIHAGRMEEIFGSVLSSQKRTALWKIEMEETALEVRRKSNAVLSIEESDSVVLAEAKRRMGPSSIEQSTTVGPSSVEQKVGLNGVTDQYAGPMLSQTSLVGVHDQMFLGGSQTEVCVAASRLDVVEAALSIAMSVCGVHMQLDASAARVDAIAAPLWLEAHGAVKVEARAGFVVQKGKLETKNSLMEAYTSLLHVFI
jgi:hypothetical protein